MSAGVERLSENATDAGGVAGFARVPGGREEPTSPRNH
jgi:hypothetical protein